MNLSINRKVCTLTFLINGEARLLILGNFSTLDTLIRASPFIQFWKIFLPPRLLGTLKTQNNIYIQIIITKYLVNLHFMIYLSLLGIIKAFLYIKCQRNPCLLRAFQPSPFIRFAGIFHPPRLLGTFYPSPFIEFLKKFHPPLLLGPPRLLGR